MEVTCKYYTENNNYRCYVYNQTIRADIKFNFVGNHEEGKTDNDVTHIYFAYCNITKVPQGLTRQFPNLEMLQIGGCSLKNISKNDLIEYKNLKKIYLTGNEIEFLPGDLFEGFEKLEIIYLRQNNLKIVEPNILDGLDMLKKIDLYGFLEYGDLKFQSSPICLDSNYKKIKSDLLNKFFQNDAQIIKNYVEKLQTKVQISQKLNTNLILENEKISQKCQELEQDNNQIAEENQVLKAEIKRKQLSLTADIKNFIQDENTKDFQIQIEGQEFPVHKFLFAARSPTLAEILKNNPEVENLNLVDISVEIFEIILKFLYTDELPGDDGTNFLQLFAAAGKLKIQDLKNFASTKLIELIDAENALEIFKIACKYDHKELKQKGFKIIKEKYPGIKLKDELIDDAEKVEKLIAYLKKMEEVERGIGDLI